jgi:hypothetical protein
MEANEKTIKNSDNKFLIFKNFKISRSCCIEWEDQTFDINNHLKGLQILKILDDINKNT